MIASRETVIYSGTQEELIALVTGAYSHNSNLHPEIGALKSNESNLFSLEASIKTIKELEPGNCKPVFILNWQEDEPVEGEVPTILARITDMWVFKKLNETSFDYCAGMVTNTLTEPLLQYIYELEDDKEELLMKLEKADAIVEEYKDVLGWEEAEDDPEDIEL